jgi:hypothetical protein
MATASFDEMQTLLDQAKAKEDAHKGVWFSLDGQRFELWPARLTLKDRKAVRSVMDRPIEAAISDLSSGEIGADTVVGLVFAAVYQDTGRRLDAEALLKWVEQVTEFDGGVMDPDSEDVTPEA